jgi:sugar lactone lactonase YvrE
LGIRSGKERLGVLVVVLITLIGVLGVGKAQAATSYRAESLFGAEAIGQNSYVPAKVAVDDSTGDVLVTDYFGARVVVFGPGGSTAAQIGEFGAGELSPPSGIAIDQSTGDVYVSSPGGISRYQRTATTPPTYAIDGTYPSPPNGSGPGEVGSFESAIAVDPRNGDLLIADTGNERISRFTRSGTFVSSFNGSDAQRGAFHRLLDLAVGSQGEIYAVDQLNDILNRDGVSVLYQFSPAGVAEEELTPIDTPRSVTFDPQSGNVLAAGDSEVDQSTGATHSRLYVFHQGEPVAAVPLPEEASGSGVSGLAAGSGAGSRIYAGLEKRAAGSQALLPFVRIEVPNATISAATAVTATSAHLAGTVDPLGSPTHYFFEYSLDGKNWTTTPEEHAGEGEGPVAVAADVGNLRPKTTYVARLVARNGEGEAFTRSTSFATNSAPPSTRTLPAYGVGETGATLSGEIDPLGNRTSYYFEYGPTAAYGSRVPISGEGVAGSAYGFRTFTHSVSGLVPGATYHYRLVARNVAGVAFGSDETFVTISSGALTPRAYEQVTPVDKEGGVLDPLIGFLASSDGSSVTYQERAVGGRVESTPWFTRFVAKRGPAGWRAGIPTDPPIEVFSAYTSYATLAIAHDYEHALVVSARKLTSDAIPNAMNLYVRDLETGKLTLVGSSEAANALPGFVGLGAAGKFVQGSPDFSWVEFVSPGPLLPGIDSAQRYRWSEASGLEVVSLLPDGSVPSLDVASTRGLRAASVDGSRSYFQLGTARENPSSGGVYLREAGQTRALSVSKVPGEPAGVLEARLSGVSEDGRYAFFASPYRLSEDAPATLGQGWGMYRYDANSDTLEFISEVGTGPVLVSRDGRTVYFEHGGFFEVLRDGEITPIGRAGGLGYASPNGRYLAYSFGGGPADVGETYVFDSDTDQLTCVSCSPEGTGFSSVPIGELVVNNEWPMVVTDQGEAFFESSSRLVPGDVNGMIDVYGFKDGRVFLVTPGTGPFNARFGGISEDGTDVFFFTDEGLVAQDRDRAVDLYDARRGGGFPAQNLAPVSPCIGEACQAIAPVMSPGPATNASEVPAERGARGGARRCHGKRAHPKARKCSRSKPSRHSPRKHRHAAHRRTGGAR